MRSLTTKLTLAFLLVSLIGIGLVALLVSSNTMREFHSFVDAQSREDLLLRWKQYYILHGSWEGTTEALPDIMPYSNSSTLSSGETSSAYPPPGPEDPGASTAPYPLIVDTQGLAVITAGGYSVGQSVPASVVQQGTAIEVDGQTVGTLIFTGKDWPDSVPRTSFLSRFSLWLYWGAGGAMLIALALGVLFSRSLTRSLRELTSAAEAMSKGKLGHSIPVRSNDEVGELAQAFNKMSSDLARSQDLRRQMTADVAHELRTPLSLVLGHAEALQDGVIPPSQETFGLIHDEALRLSRLVDDLRTLSLSDAGELALDRQPISPKELLAQAAAAYGEAARERRVTLNVESPELPDVYADAYRIVQVLANLINNALRHTPTEGTITLTTRAEEGFVRFGVRDSGPGISAEELPFIFERFYRSDKSRKRQGDSTGLGLSIARSIVEMHGGTIDVQSPPGEGATFSFTLPLAATVDSN